MATQHTANLKEDQSPEGSAAVTIAVNKLKGCVCVYGGLITLSILHHPPIWPVQKKHGAGVDSSKSPPFCF